MPVSPLTQALAFQNQVQPAQAPIGPADVLGAYKLASDVAEKNYQAKVQQQMGLWGGLASLGAAGILGFPALKKALGGAATNAAGSGATAAAPAAASPAAAPAASADAAAVPGADATALGEFDGLGYTAPTVAADFGGGAGAGTVAADLAGAGGAGAGGSVLADLTAAAPAAGDAAATGLPDFLASFLPFLA